MVVGCLPPPCGVVWCGVVWFGCGLWWFPPFPSCAMGQLSQGSGLSGNTVRVTAALFVGVLFRKCLTVTWDAILVTVDGFGFGTLTGESCLKNVHCHTDRASWDAILLTVVAFGAFMWKSVHSHTVSALGKWGGGIPLGGGGSVNREPGSYILLLWNYMPQRPSYSWFCGTYFHISSIHGPS